MIDTEAAHDPSTPATKPGASTLRTWLVRGAIAIILILAGWYIGWFIEWGTVWQALKTVHLIWLPAAIIATLGAHMARAIRWRELIPEGKSISIFNLFSAVIIGYLMNNVIPRSGEIGRPYVLARREGRPTSELLATVIVERMLDGISLLVIFISLIFTTVGGRLDQIFPDYPISAILRSIALPMIVVIVLLVVVMRTSLGDRFLAFLERKLPAHLHGRLVGLLNDFRNGISVGGGKGAVSIFFWTIAIWLGYMLALYFGMLGFGFDTAYGLGLDDALALLAVTAVGITIAPTPGGFGVYHGFCMAALRALYNIPDGIGWAFAIVTHAAPYLTVMVLGACFLLREKVSFREISRQKIQPGSTP